VKLLLRTIKFLDDNMAASITLFTLIASLIGIFLNILGRSYALIIALLIIISFDLVAIIHGYLKKDNLRSKVMLENIEKLINSELLNRNRINTQQTYYQTYAKKINDKTVDIFISGINLQRVSSERQFLSDLNERVELRLLSLNHKEDDIIIPFCKMRYKDYETTKKKYESLKNSYENMIGTIAENKKNIHERLTKRIIPCSFFAVNIRKPDENSFIEVHYYLPEKRTDEKTFSFIAISGTELFDTFREQIDLLWEEGEIVHRN